MRVIIIVSILANGIGSILQIPKRPDTTIKNITNKIPMIILLYLFLVFALTLLSVYQIQNIICIRPIAIPMPAAPKP